MIVIDFLVVVLVYFFGFILMVVWIGKVKYGIDVRQYGSKNVGVINIFCVLGKKVGKVVLVIDVLKGMLVVLILYFLLLYLFIVFEIIYVQLVVVFFVVFGYVFLVFVGFKGGKGVVILLGCIIGL